MTPRRPFTGFLLSLWIRFLLLITTIEAYTTLSDETLEALPRPNNDFDIHNGALLAPILQPRVPGAPGSTAVLNHFVHFFQHSLPDWKIQFQNSTSKTPTSGGQEVPFVNFIAYRDPPWADPGGTGRLTLVAHYDSKLTPDGFIGATDSAAPCAMIMHAARSIDTALAKKWAAMQAENVGDGGFDVLEEDKGVQIILLDGEEAFITWTNTDSLYGSRSLAETWEQQFHPALSTYKTALSSISLFLLLDLLGAKNPNVPSYFKTTHWAYQKMATLESRLRDLHQFKSSPNHRSTKRATSNSATASIDTRAETRWLVDASKQPNAFRSFMIEDDHVPFMARGVEVLHIIPAPFPDVWHEMADDGEHLDLDTVEDWSTLVTAFVGEWMDLEGFFDTSVPAQAERKMGRGKRDQVISKTEL